VKGSVPLEEYMTVTVLILRSVQYLFWALYFATAQPLISNFCWAPVGKCPTIQWYKSASGHRWIARPQLRIHHRTAFSTLIKCANIKFKLCHGVSHLFMQLPTECLLDLKQNWNGHKQSAKPSSVTSKSTWHQVKPATHYPFLSTVILCWKLKDHITRSLWR